jgi:hypothetical protein
MKKCLLALLALVVIASNATPSRADGVYWLGNTANDSDVNGFASGVTDPNGGAVTLGALFSSSAYAETRSPLSSVSAPDLASTFNDLGTSYFEATGLTDPAPIATTQVTATSIGGGPSGSALARASFFQTFSLAVAGTYTYDFLTGFSGSFFAFGDGSNARGYSRAGYALGWWDPGTGRFVDGQFVQSGTYEMVVNGADINGGLNGSLQFAFGNAPAGALPAYFAWSESAAAVPEPGTLLLLGSGLAGLAAIRSRRRA